VDGLEKAERESAQLIHETPDAFQLHRERELCGKGGFQPAWCGTAPTMWLDEGGPGAEPYSSGG
jgi:hypothetical protein